MSPEGESVSTLAKSRRKEGKIQRTFLSRELQGVTFCYIFHDLEMEQALRTWSLQTDREYVFLLFFVPLLDKEEIEHSIWSPENTVLSSKDSLQHWVRTELKCPSLNLDHFLFMSHWPNNLPRGICFFICKMREIIVPTTWSWDEDSRKWCIWSA